MDKLDARTLDMGVGVAPPTPEARYTIGESCETGMKPAEIRMFRKHMTGALTLKVTEGRTASSKETRSE